MKKLKYILTSKDGFSTLFISLAFLFFLLLVTIILLVTTEFRAVTLSVTQTADEALEDYISSESTDILDSIKSGNTYTFELDTELYIEYLANALGIDENLKGIKTNGRSFEITSVVLDYDTIDNLDVTATFTLTMPLEVAGVTYRGLNTTVYLHAQLEDMF